MMVLMFDNPHLTRILSVTVYLDVCERQKKKGDVLSRFLESNEIDPKFLKDITPQFLNGRQRHNRYHSFMVLLHAKQELFNTR